MRKPNVDIPFVLCNPLVELKQSIFDKTNFSIFVLAVKIFYCFRNANQQKSICGNRRIALLWQTTCY